MFGLSYNVFYVILGTMLLGLVAGVVGSFAVLRKKALLTDALAHCTLPGVCVAYLVLYALDIEKKSLLVFLLFAFFSSLIGLLSISYFSRSSRVSSDTAIGVVLSSFFGFGVLLLGILQYLPNTNAAGVNSFIYGQTASIVKRDVDFLLMLSVAVFLSTLFLKRYFFLISFDEFFALTLGYKVLFLDALLMVLVLLVTVLGIQIVGIILVIAMLLVPFSTARFWTNNLNLLLFLSAFFGALSGLSGAVLSAYYPKLPAGAVIVCMSGFFFFLSFTISPKRGFIFVLLRSFIDRLQVSTDHFLRDVYEQAEVGNIKIREQRVEKPRLVLFCSLALRGLIENCPRSRPKKDLIVLTEKGAKKALELTRNHRLWEEYLHEYGAFSQSHVHYGADKVEHYLSFDLISELEVLLKQKGKLPAAIDGVTNDGGSR